MYGRRPYGFGYGGFGRRPFGYGFGVPFLGGFVGGLAAGALLTPGFGYGGYPGYRPFYPPYYYY
ncbi:spore coat protein [Bacillus mesophilum]|uniref:Spore coat protein n=1 Tax=Bacillus mesophilum TaxID=1071718 RepID=A0A7V7UUU3_9BACI|nr:spore coat protein [Bacillus mesophilum]KAB2331995.1 spore coat protein [Bacillus mesophilum]